MPVRQRCGKGRGGVRWRTWSWHAPLVRAASNGLVRAMTHVLVLVGGYELYRAISTRAPHRPALAHAHAGALIALERKLGILIEPRLQHAALHDAWLGSTGLLTAASVQRLVTLAYAGSQLQWLAAMLLWLYLFQRPHFTLMRNLVIATTLLAVVFATFYPVAPPRFALSGPPYFLEDVLHKNQGELFLVQRAVFDPYSSLPSGHVLWALLTGLGLFLGATTTPRRLLAAAFPLVMVLTVVATGNHYLLDCVGSVVLLLGCMVAAAGLRRCAAQRTLGRRYAAGLLANRPLTERRRNPNLRPLDRPLILGAIAATLLLVSSDTTQRLTGLALLSCATIVIPLARHRARSGVSLRPSSAGADWVCGFLFIAGTTTIGADDQTARLCGSLLWLVAGVLPLLARLRTVSARPAPASNSVRRGHREWRGMVP